MNRLPLTAAVLILLAGIGPAGAAELNAPETGGDDARAEVNSQSRSKDGVAQIAMEGASPVAPPGEQASGGNADLDKETAKPDSAGTSDSAPESGAREATSEGVEGESRQADQQGAGSTILKGGVRGTAIRTMEGLNSIEQAAKLVQMDVFQIMRECTRKETAFVGGPNYIGNGIVIPAIGNPSGTMQVGDLPARREKLEAFLGASEDAFNVLSNHMDALILPENPSAELSNLWTGMRSTLGAARGNIDKMKTILEQPKFNKKQVGSAALKVYDSMTALEKMRAQILKMLEKNS